jgi:mono/diheme cytochrome c family protein
MRSTHLLLGVLFAVAAAAASAAEEEEKVGAQMYRKYCGACHGLEGKGDGIVSGFLRPQPTDLTQLASKHGGEFPFAYVMRAIDGRETVRSHGSSEMPVWGEILKEEAGEGLAADTAVRGKILLITEHLRTIQVDSGGTE